jgi:NAD+ diphosphatase
MSIFNHISESPSKDLGFSGDSLDRAGWRRDDMAWQQEALLDRSSRFVLICNDTPVLGFDGARLEALFDLANASNVAPYSQAMFMGLDEGIPWFALHLEADHFEGLKLRDTLKLIDMRSVAVQGLFSSKTTSTIGTAKAMFLWHQRHRFCGQCGSPTEMASAGWKRVCRSCASEHFPRTDPVVIMLAVDGDRCLMGRAPRFPEGMYSCLAGFMEPGETIEDATRREIFEETGIRTNRVRYLAAQPWPFPGSLMIGCFAEATSTEITIDATEIADARWFTRDEVRLILRGEHPKGLICPPKMAIANHIMRAFVET